MSNIPNRILNIGKAYLDQVRSRIDAELTEREKDLAERELDSDPGDPSPGARREGGTPRPAMDDNSPEALMRRAEERIAAARRAAESRAELDRVMHEAAGRVASAESATAAARQPEPSRAEASAPATNSAASADPNASDYRVLGVPVGSDLATVQVAYETLSRRCDPTRFEGSEYKKDAEKILARINTAYDSLRRRLDPTENRFGKLELE